MERQTLISRSFAQTYELCIGHYYTEPEAIEQLAKYKATYSNKKEWKASNQNQSNPCKGITGFNRINIVG